MHRGFVAQKAMNPQFVLIIMIQHETIIAKQQQKSLKQLLSKRDIILKFLARQLTLKNLNSLCMRGSQSILTNKILLNKEYPKHDIKLLNF